MKELATIMVKISNSKSIIKYKNKSLPYENNNYSNEKLLKKLNTSLTYSVEEAIKEIVENYEDRYII